jgi:nucleotide-binding universal stress UspA family protein
MKNILVATDFSPKAQKATRVGIELAKQFKSQIHFLHVFHTPVNWSKLPKEHEARFPEVKAEMNKAKQLLSEAENNAKHEGLEADSFLSFDHENMNVLQHVQTHKHDLVVIGSHSRLSITDVLFGSVAINIIENSPVPVLMVDEADGFTTAKNILVAVDPDSNVIEFIKKVSDLFPTSGVKIKAFSVRLGSENENEKILAGLNDLIRRQTADNVTYETVNAASVEEGVVGKANGREGDLLVIGPNRFNRVADYLRAHVFPSLSSRVQKPLLILK